MALRLLMERPAYARLGIIHLCSRDSPVESTEIAANPRIPSELVDRLVLESGSMQTSFHLDALSWIRSDLM